MLRYRKGGDSAMLTKSDSSTATIDIVTTQESDRSWLADDDATMNPWIYAPRNTRAVTRRPEAWIVEVLDYSGLGSDSHLGPM